MLFKKSKKLFIHVDCDCFFASCEILKNPHLKGKMVCVGNEIVIACSYEAKAMGIKTGTPIWEAKRILGKFGYYFGTNHNYYSYISDKIMKYLENNTLSIEPFSIDEAFCEITGLAEMYKLSISDYIKKLQNNILKHIGIPVSIGVANTRIKAKIYSKINKPYGVYIGYNDFQEKTLFKKLPLKDIPYIGKSHQERYKYCCKTIYDYISLGFWQIKKDIGKNGTDLWLDLSGVNTFVVKKNPQAKSIGRSRSFNKYMTSNYDFLKSQLIIHFDTVYEDISNKNLEIKTISIMLRDKDFNTYMYNYKLKEHTNLRNIIFEKLIKLFNKNYQKNILYRSTGIVLSDFKSYLPKQLGIFDKPLRNKEHNFKLVKAINSINQKYNSHKISFGIALLNKGYDAKLGIRK